MIGPFFIGAMLIVLMSLVAILTSEISEFQRQNVPIQEVLFYVLYKLPGFLKLALPVGMAFAASLAFSRLNRESELTAIRSGGVSINRMIQPVMVLGIIIGILNFYVTDYLEPMGARAAHEIRYKFGIENNPADTRSNEVVNLKDYIVAMGAVTRTPNKRLIIRDVLIIKEMGDTEKLLMTSSRGNYSKHLWEFEEVTIRHLRGNKLISMKKENLFSIKEKIKISHIFSPRPQQEMTVKKLRKAIATAKKQKRDYTPLLIAFHEKFSFPFACVVFAITGPACAVWFSKGGAFIGVLLSVFLVMGYWNVQVISTEIIGRHGALPPVFSAWLPNIIFVTLGLVAIRRIE